jgi:hypothetical protein
MSSMSASLSLSLTRRACNPYCERHLQCRIIQGLSHILCSIPRQPIWAGTRSDIYSSVQGPPLGSKRRQLYILWMTPQVPLKRYIPLLMLTFGRKQ